MGLGRSVCESVAFFSFRSPQIERCCRAPRLRWFARVKNLKFQRKDASASPPSRRWSHARGVRLFGTLSCCGLGAQRIALPELSKKLANGNTHKTKQRVRRPRFSNMYIVRTRISPPKPGWILVTFGHTESNGGEARIDLRAVHAARLLNCPPGDSSHPDHHSLRARPRAWPCPASPATPRPREAAALQ